MAVNPVINPYRHVNEQRQLINLNQEAIRNSGVDVMYLPKVTDDLDKIYLEDDRTYYNKAITIDAYIISSEGFEGDGHFMSNLGLQIRDQIVLAISTKTFDEEIGGAHHKSRPTEGDLIFFPFSERLFEVRFVKKFSPFYSTGALPVWEVRCEVFEYSNQRFETGVTVIDNLSDISQNIFDFSLTTEDGRQLTTESGNYLVPDTYDIRDQDPLDDTDSIQVEADEIIDHTEIDPYSDGIY